jgi:hypothetical protein
MKSQEENTLTDGIYVYYCKLLVTISGNAGCTSIKNICIKMLQIDEFIGVIYSIFCVKTGGYKGHPTSVNIINTSKLR